MSILSKILLGSYSPALKKMYIKNTIYICSGKGTISQKSEKWVDEANYNIINILYLYASNCEKLKGTAPSVKSSIKTHPAENMSMEADNSPEFANSASSAVEVVDSSGIIEDVRA